MHTGDQSWGTGDWIMILCFAALYSVMLYWLWRNYRALPEEDDGDWRRGPDDDPPPSGPPPIPSGEDVWTAQSATR